MTFSSKGNIDMSRFSSAAFAYFLNNSWPDVSPYTLRFRRVGKAYGPKRKTPPKILK